MKLVGHEMFLLCCVTLGRVTWKDSICSSDVRYEIFLNQARAGCSAWFLKIDPVRIVCMRVCVSAPEAINN